jgi:hypothetical protein
MNKIESAKLPQGGACRPDALMNTAYRRPSANPLCALLIFAVLAASSLVHAQSTTGIYVNSSNNVGIDTTSPQTNLDVQGNGSDSQDILRVTRGGGNQSRVQIGHCYIQRYDGTGTPNSLCINANGGNVGIGTMSPDKTLVVSNTLSGSASTVSVLTRFVNNGSGNTVLLDLTDAHTSDGIITFTGSTTATSDLLGFGVNAVQKMVIDGNGNVGIGTTGPQSKLHVYQSAVDAVGFVLQGNTINTDNLQHYIALTLDGDYGNATGNYSQIRSYSNLYNMGQSISILHNNTRSCQHFSGKNAH